MPWVVLKMQDQQKTLPNSLLLHLGALCLLTILVSIFSSSLSIDQDIGDFSRVFLLLAASGVGHFLTFIRKEVNLFTLFLFFLVDLPITFVLVRETGGSASPFLVIYPLLSLAGSILFNQKMGIGYLAFVILFQSFSVGFVAGMIGNVLASVATAVLGFYLVIALRKSDAALVVSEGQRRRLENLQRAILANMPSGLISVDSQGRVIQVNGVGLKILELSESDVLYKPLRGIMPLLSDQVVKLNTLVPSINQFSGQLNDLERPTVRFSTPSGRELQLGFSVSRLQDPVDKSILGSLVVFQDLTKIARMEEDLRMSEKLAAIGKLAAGIAHEIRNPLAGISGSAQLLMGANEMNDEDKKLLQIIQRESGRLDSLITEFLEYVKPPRAKMERIDLLKISEHVMEQMRVHSKWRGTKANLSIKNLAAPKTEVWALGDGNKITQVLINLVINSAQAGSQNIEVRVSDQSPSIEVSDDGSGITAENQKRIFEPFFTTKESGTGLGLAVSYRALEAMQAKVEVRSPSLEGRGTLFRLQFKSENAA